MGHEITQQKLGSPISALFSYKLFNQEHYLSPNMRPIQFIFTPIYSLIALLTNNMIQLLTS